MPGWLSVVCHWAARLGFTSVIAQGQVCESSKTLALNPHSIMCNLCEFGKVASSLLSLRFLSFQNAYLPETLMRPTENI